MFFCHLVAKLTDSKKISWSIVAYIFLIFIIMKVPGYDISLCSWSWILLHISN